MAQKEISKITYLCREIEKLHNQLRELQVKSLKECPAGVITMEMLYGKNIEKAKEINKKINMLNNELEKENERIAEENELKNKKG